MNGNLLNTYCIYPQNCGIKKSKLNPLQFVIINTKLNSKHEKEEKNCEV